MNLIFIWLLPLLIFRPKAETNTLINIQFLYQKNTDIKAGFYENPLVEEQFNAVYDTVANQEGKVSLSFLLTEPRILHVRTRAMGYEVYKFYISPGDTLDISITNKFNMSFSGEGARENALMLNADLISDPVGLPFERSDGLEACYEAIEGDYQTRLSLIDEYDKTSGADRSFISYCRAEADSYKFHCLHYLPTFQEYQGDPLLELVREELNRFDILRDEYRSHFFLRAVGMHIDDRQLRQTGKGTPWEKRFLVRQQLIEQELGAFENLKKRLRFATVNTMILTAQDTVQLAFAHSWMDTLAAAFPDAGLNLILRERHDWKYRGLRLREGIDFTGWNPDNQQVSLASFKGRPILVAFWATWNKPAMDYLARLNELAEKYREKNPLILAVNIWDEESDWRKVIAARSYPSLTHLYVPKADSDKLAKACFFKTLPSYVLIDKEYKVIQAGEDRLNDMLLNLFLAEGIYPLNMRRYPRE